jgi:hypothetical protein
LCHVDEGEERDISFGLRMGMLMLRGYAYSPSFSMLKVLSEAYTAGKMILCEDTSFYKLLKTGRCEG